MEERIVFMQEEDNKVTFERESGQTIIYPKYLIPAGYKQGDIIKANIISETNIVFLGLDEETMKERMEAMVIKKALIKLRAKRNNE